MPGLTMFYDHMPLVDARDQLRKLAVDGHECPCCRQLVKVYRRKLTASMAYMLVKMYHAGASSRFVHLPHLSDGAGARDTTMPQYWGLIEEEKSKRPDGGRRGWWKLTPLGTEFVLNERAVPKYARVYNGRRLGTDGPPVTIYDALGTKFNYTDLMAGV